MSQASVSMGRFRTKIQSWFLSANVVLTNMKSRYNCVEFLPYSFETLGLPASSQRSLLVVCSQDMVPAELRKVFLSFQQAIAKAATLKMVHCLAKHSSDTVKYEMEMMRRGSKRAVEDANLAGPRSFRWHALQEKVFDKMFGGSLPSPLATNPGVWNSRPLCGTARGVAQAEPSHPCSCMCVGAPSCQH